MDEKSSGEKLYEIVGVVKDARYFNMRDDTAEPMMFIPLWRNFVHRSELVIRTSGSTAQLAALLRREIHALDPVIPLENLHTLEHDIDENILVERMVATLSGVFGVLALLLSAVGLYGVIAYTVTRRTREIGIRIAIGAPRQSVLWLVLRDVLSMVLIGGVIGSLAAFLATRAIASILYGVSAHDPLSLMAAGFSLAMAALVASFLPARRATKIDPTVALRYE
jgi:ABC-type antimicrobial peptide transport system permease subunit